MAAAVQAQAAIYTYDFSATITTVHLITSPWGGPEVSSSLGPDGVSILKTGDGIIGRFSFDDAVVPSTISYPGQYTVFEYNSGVTLSYTFVNSGATTSVPAAISIGIRGLDSRDDLVLNGVGDDGYYGQLRFRDASHALFNAGLPKKAFTRADLSGALMNDAWNLTDGQLVGYRAEVTSVSLVPAPVPEPATWGLMLAGLGVLGFAARRARHQ